MTSLVLNLPKEAVIARKTKGPRHTKRNVGIIGGIVVIAAGSFAGYKLLQTTTEAQVAVTTAAGVDGPAGTIVVTEGSLTIAELNQKLIAAGVPGALTTTEAGIWNVNQPLLIDKGAELTVASSTLRLRSDAVVVAGIRVINGTLDVQDSNVTSWDQTINGGDIKTSDGRAQIDVTGEGHVVVNNTTFTRLGAGARDGGAIAGFGNHASITVNNSTFNDNVQAVLADDAQLMISNSTILRSQDEGVEIRGITPGNALVQKVSAKNSGGAGIYTERPNTVIKDSDAFDNTEGGIKINAGADGSEINKSRTANNGERGIRLSASNLKVTSNLVWNNPEGIEVSDTAGDVLIQDNSVSANLNRGITIDSGADGVTTVVGNRVDHNVHAGIQIESGRVIARDGNIVMQNELGFRINAESPQVDILNNTVSGNFRDGFQLVQIAGLNISGNTIADNDSSAFSVVTKGDATPFLDKNQIGQHRNGAERVRS